MRRMSRDQAVIPGTEFDLIARDPQPRLTLKQADPFVLLLIVEHRLRLVAAQNALDAHTPTGGQFLEELATGECWQIGEEIAHGPPGLHRLERAGSQRAGGIILSMVEHSRLGVIDGSSLPRRLHPLQSAGDVAKNSMGVPGWSRAEIVDDSLSMTHDHSLSANGIATHQGLSLLGQRNGLGD
jgi:hypothetical protein